MVQWNTRQSDKSELAWGIDMGIFNWSKLFVISKVKFRKLNHTISSAALEAIEKKYNFSLPAEYRTFISKVGNGGILPANESDDTELVLFNEDLGLDHVQENFLPKESCFDFDTNEFLSVKNVGYIQIATTACDHAAWLLVITGAYRGEIWLRDEYGLLRLPSINFYEWLNLYLNNQLSSKIQELSEQQKTQKKSDDRLLEIKESMGSKRCAGIEWNPPISVEEVRVFEMEHRIELPVEYVEFITKIADGCSNFLATNSKKQGGTMFRLKDFSGLNKLNIPFLFDKNTEELRFNLLRNYNRQNSIWQSELFMGIPKNEPISGVWAAPEYSMIPGVLPFAVYHDTGLVGMNTQALLVLNGPLKGQIWKATKYNLSPDGESETLYTWLIRMMKYGVI